MDNIQQFMLSELDNCFNMLTNFKAFLHLAMYKQPKQKINDTINGVKGEKTILLYKLTEQFPFEVTLCR